MDKDRGKPIRVYGNDHTPSINNSESTCCSCDPSFIVNFMLRCLRQAWLLSSHSIISQTHRHETPRNTICRQCVSKCNSPGEKTTMWTRPQSRWFAFQGEPASSNELPGLPILASCLRSRGRLTGWSTNVPRCVRVAIDASISPY